MVRYPNRNLHGHVLDILGRRIVSGELPPGALIDTDQLERDLTVSRTVIREVIKVLTSKGLVGARTRYGTFVRPRADWNLLDSDVMFWRDHGRPDAQLFQDLVEVRQAIEPVGARLAASRHTEEDIRELEEALAELASPRGADVDRHIAADVRFHRAILTASKNELLARLEVVLEPALRARDRAALEAPGAGDYVALHAAVLDAIRSRDAEAAARAMTELLTSAAADTAALVADAASAARPPAKRGRRSVR